MADTNGNDNERDNDRTESQGGAIPMPHGSDTSAPLPPEDGALPMPHGHDDDIPEWSGAQRDKE